MSRRISVLKRRQYQPREGRQEGLAAPSHSPQFTPKAPGQSPCGVWSLLSPSGRSLSLPVTLSCHSWKHTTSCCLLPLTSRLHKNWSCWGNPQIPAAERGIGREGTSGGKHRGNLLELHPRLLSLGEYEFWGVNGNH